MPPEDGSPCRRLSSLCEDSDVDFSAFHFLALDSTALEENVADSIGLDPMSPVAFIPQEGVVAEAKSNEKPDKPATEAENTDDAVHGLRADSSDPLLFTDGMQHPATNAANSPAMRSHERHASPRPLQPRPSTANAACLPFPDIAIKAEDGNPAYTEATDPLRGRLGHFDPSDIFQSHEMQFAARRRSQSVPPNDMSFHRHLGTGSKLHIGTGRPKNRPTGSIQKPHPYANALSKRHNDSRQILQNQRLANAPQKMFRAHQHADGMLYPPPANATLGPAALEMALQNATAHPDAPPRCRPNAPIQPAPARQVALADAQRLCERTLYRVWLAAEGVRQDAIMMGQDPALEMCVSPGYPARLFLTWGFAGRGRRSARRTPGSARSTSSWRYWRCILCTSGRRWRARGGR
jgi:hypothetical protein